MLAEMYLHLKEAFPVHGLEIVFVSSDRDQLSFESYFASMPWLALPFASLGQYKQMLSTIYGIRGIPSLVVLDAVSGNIVSDASTARGEVAHACRSGDDGIETLFRSWLDRVPSSTKEMIDMLQLSCVDAAVKVEAPEDDANGVTSYLWRLEPQKTVSAVAEEGQADWVCGVLASHGDKTIELSGIRALLDEEDKEATKEALATILAYLVNAGKAPYNPKYRSVKLSNKIADRITRTSQGIWLLQRLGFDIVAMDSDYYASILPECDIDATINQLKGILEQST